jgi:hypothetical protein
MGKYIAHRSALAVALALVSKEAIARVVEEMVAQLVSFFTISL